MTPKKKFGRVSKRTLRCCFVGFLVAAEWIISPNHARAEAPRYEIELLVAPNLPDCNRQAEFLALLMPLVPGPAFDSPATRALRVSISKTPSGAFGVDIVFKEINSQKIDSTHSEFPANMACFEVLYRAAVRSASLMQRDLLSSQASTQSAPTAPLQCPKPTTSTPCPTEEPRKPGPPKPKPIKRRRFGGAGGVLALGVAPDTVFGAQFVIGWKPAPFFSLELDGRATFPRDTRPLGLTIVHVTTVASATIAPCYRFGSFGACGLIMATNAWLESVGVSASDANVVSTLGFGGRGFLEHRLADRWSVRVDVDIVVPIARTQIEDVSLLRWTPPPITGSIGASMLVQF